jgi:uncharacterized membrane protein SpoIIM required for sporulation
VRREARLVALLSLMFFGPLAATFTLDLRHPELVFSVMAPGQVASLERMYDPESEHYGVPPGTGDGIVAFLYYVGNNVAVAFRAFAGGMFCDIGSLFVIAINAVLIGVVAGHLTHVGFASTFFPFVIGHGAFELTAIVLAGVAGMRIGLALIAPGRKPRAVALREVSARVVPFLYGMVVMLLFAAVLEGLWSGSAAVPAQLKLAVGALL